MLTTLGRRLPSSLAKVLFGDRPRYGRQRDPSDGAWQAWTAVYDQFYHDTQKKGVGKAVNDAGYRVLKQVSLDGCRVLEVGPGDLPHMRFWRGTPASVVLVDERPAFVERSAALVRARGIPATTVCTDARVLPVPDASIDVIISFYSLEHLFPLQAYLDECRRVLRAGGVLVGGIPAEGGLAWGIGRALTTRRYFKRTLGLDLDKIICWEHPNFADEIIRGLDATFQREHLDFWPLRLPVVDLNLIVTFVYRRAA